MESTNTPNYRKLVLPIAKELFWVLVVLFNVRINTI